MPALDANAVRDLVTVVSAKYKNLSTETSDWAKKIATREVMTSENVVFVYPTLPRDLVVWPDGNPLPSSDISNFRCPVEAVRYGQGLPLSLMRLSDIAGNSALADLGEGYGVSDATLTSFYREAAELKNMCDSYPNRIAKALLQAGKTTPCHVDGVNFFSASHPSLPVKGLSSGTSVNQSNLFTSTALTATNAEVVRKAMRAYVAENGVLWGISPNFILVPPSLEVTARQIYNSDNVATALNAGETSVGSVTNQFKGLCEVIVAPELENEPTVWYMGVKGRSQSGLIFGDREPSRIQCLDSPQSSRVFEYEQILWKASIRFGMSFGHWATLARCEA